MLYHLKVIPRAKNNSIEEKGGFFKVKLTAAPEKGKANQALINILADYFKVKKSDIKIVKGLTSRDKIIEIEK